MSGMRHQLVGLTWQLHIPSSTYSIWISPARPGRTSSSAAAPARPQFLLRIYSAVAAVPPPQLLWRGGPAQAVPRQAPRHSTATRLAMPRAAARPRATALPRLDRGSPDPTPPRSASARPRAAAARSSSRSVRPRLLNLEQRGRPGSSKNIPFRGCTQPPAPTTKHSQKLGPTHPNPLQPVVQTHA